jgi:hypothetical protein
VKRSWRAYPLNRLLKSTFSLKPSPPPTISTSRTGPHQPLLDMRISNIFRRRQKPQSQPTENACMQSPSPRIFRQHQSGHDEAPSLSALPLQPFLLMGNVMDNDNVPSVIKDYVATTERLIEAATEASSQLQLLQCQNDSEIACAHRFLERLYAQSSVVHLVMSLMC